MGDRKHIWKKGILKNLILYNASKKEEEKKKTLWKFILQNPRKFFLKFFHEISDLPKWTKWFLFKWTKRVLRKYTKWFWVKWIKWFLHKWTKWFVLKWIKWSILKTLVKYGSTIFYHLLQNKSVGVWRYTHFCERFCVLIAFANV